MAMPALPRTSDFKVKHRFSLRGIFEDEEDSKWNEVPAFATKKECQEGYTAECTNPQFPLCDHIYTHACGWDQVVEFILRPLEHMRRKYPVRPPPPLPFANRFRESAGVLRGLSSRLRLPIHEVVTEDSTLNTLRYLYFHMRCGIFVMIRQNRVVLFVPFVNRLYVNTWGGGLQLEGGASVEEYYRRKRAVHRRREGGVMGDKRLWWANGNIMCNVQSERFWGDSYLTQLRHMLNETLAHRTVPDCEFFINKRDFPHLKKSGDKEPYDFLYDVDGTPLARERYASFCPLGSFFLSHEFADLPLVCTDDWETATGLVFPPGGVDIRSAANRKTFHVEWADRKPTAIFRGNSTGPGTLPETNQRLKLAQLSSEWASSELYGDGNPVDGVRYLNAGVVGWNRRDRKNQGTPMTFVEPSALEERGILKVERVPMYKQAQCKYQIYVDGHCAAMRYASMMPLGSVILKVASVTKADHMWYFPLLNPVDISKPFDVEAGDAATLGDHIPVAADLSDLADVLTWCKRNDAACEQIAKNAAALYDKLISREGLLDYTQLMLHGVARRFVPGAELGRQILAATGASVAAAGAGTDKGPMEAAQVALCAQGPPVGDRGSAGTLLGDGGADWAAAGVDWFGAANVGYAETRIGVSTRPAPQPKHVPPPGVARAGAAARTSTGRKPAASARAAAGGARGPATVSVKQQQVQTARMRERTQKTTQAWQATLAQRLKAHAGKYAVNRPGSGVAGQKRPRR